MATIVRCDHCGRQAEAGHQWLRVQLQPFYPHRISSSMGSPEVIDESYNEGLRAEACSPHCAAMALEQQADTLSAGYGRLAGAMGRSGQTLREQLGEDWEEKTDGDRGDWESLDAP